MRTDNNQLRMIFWAVLLIAGLFTAQGALADSWLTPERVRAAEKSLNDLKMEFPGVRDSKSGQTITRLYGRSFSNGATPELSAQNFINEHAGVFGVSPNNITPGNIKAQTGSTQGLMYNRETDEYKFTLVQYSQYLDGIPVFDSELKLLVRNESEFPVVLASSSLRDLGDFKLNSDVIGQRSSVAENAAKADEPEIETFEDIESVVWAGTIEEPIEPRTAVKFMGLTGSGRPYIYVADPLTGEIYFKHDLLDQATISATVEGKATVAPAADYCPESVELPEAIRHAYVYEQGGLPFLGVVTDINGYAELDEPAGVEFTAQAVLNGTYFQVHNLRGDEAVLYKSVIPPGQISFMFNDDNNDEYVRAQVNAYVHANLIRDRVEELNPSFAGINEKLQIYTNILNSDTHDNSNLCPCNAWHISSTLNFCADAGDCSNSAFSSIIYHEYAHHLINSANGSNSYQYGEGMADALAVLMMDSPDLALGFQGSCNEYYRTADNDFQYPCHDQYMGYHYCGQLLSGCIWSTRDELELATYPDYLDILFELTLNSIPVHTGSRISPQIYIDFITLDDDNSDLSDLTPHYSEITDGFEAHNMVLPAVQATIPYPNLICDNLATDINAGFDPFEIDGTTVDDESFVAHSRLAGKIPGVVTYTSQYKTAIFNPDNDLKRGDVITYTLTDDIALDFDLPTNISPYVGQFHTLTDAPSNGTFGSLTNHSTGDRPFSVTSGYFNGDGDIDFTTADYDGDNISVRLSDGNGGYNTVDSYTAGDGPWGIISAEFDGQPGMDLAVTNANSDNVTVFFNNGSGDFDDPSANPSVTISVGDKPHCIFGADIDGDGDIDLMTANYNSHNVSIVTNNGDGTFNTHVTYATANSPIGISAADVDNDGDFDIATANLSSTVSVLYNDGAGNFGSLSRNDYAVGNGASSLCMVDLNTDLFIDIVTANRYSSDVTVLINNKNGTFDNEYQEDYDVVGQPYSIFAIDLDGSNTFDIVTACFNTDNISILYNNGTGFENHVDLAVDDGPVWVTSSDVDDDGWMDIITANSISDNISVLFGENIPGPILASPVNGYSTTMHYIRLDWLDYFGAASYNVEIDDNGVFGTGTTIETGITASEWAINPTLDHGTWYWRVQANLNAGGTSDYSDVWHFTIENDDPPSCPVLFVKSGDEFVQENPLLTACEKSGYVDIVTDYYHLNSPVTAENGTVTFQLRELEDEITYLSDIELITVDHCTDTRVACAVDGNIVTYNEYLAPISAVDNNGVDQLASLVGEDGILFKASESGYLDVTFENQSTGTGLLFGGIPKGICLDPRLKEIHTENSNAMPPEAFSVEYKSASGEWVEYSDIPVRDKPINEFIIFEDAPNESQTTTIRVSWEGSYTTDAILQFVTSNEIPEVKTHSIENHNLVLSKATQDTWSGFDGNQPLVLRKGDVFEFEFKIDGILGDGLTRDYIIRAVGRYQPDYSVYTHLKPNQFQLYDNYPNPFNPTTTLSYDLHAASHVKLDILNILGQRVTTLVDANQPAGHYEVVWDGQDIDGDAVASGIYFYRIVAGDFIESRKMTLLK